MAVARGGSARRSGAFPSSTGSWRGCSTRPADDLTDPVTSDGDEREVVAEYLAAHETTEAAERDSAQLSPGDVAAAVNGLRAVFDHIVTTRSRADADLETADAETEEA